MKFKAGVQYGDWEGTAAADNADETSFTKRLLDQGLIGENEFLVGIEIWSGENHAGVASPPTVYAYVVDGDSHANVGSYLSNKSTPAKVKQVEITLSYEEFFGLFKRFNVVLTGRELDLVNREYEIEE